MSHLGNLGHIFPFIYFFSLKVAHQQLKRVTCCTLCCSQTIRGHSLISDGLSASADSIHVCSSSYSARLSSDTAGAKAVGWETVTCAGSAAKFWHYWWGVGVVQKGGPLNPVR